MGKKKKAPKRKVHEYVLDGSVALAWCFADEADPYADAVARKIPDSRPVVPAIWHLEVANALLVGERRQRCDQADTSTWMAHLASLPIVVDGQAPAHVFTD